MSVEDIRTELRRLARQVPFESYIIAFIGGETAVIEHPENVAFDPTPGASSGFYVFTGRLRMASRFEAVSSITTLSSAIPGGNGRTNGP